MLLDSIFLRGAFDEYTDPESVTSGDLSEAVLELSCSCHYDIGVFKGPTNIIL